MTQNILWVTLKTKNVSSCYLDKIKIMQSNIYKIHNINIHIDILVFDFAQNISKYTLQICSNVKATTALKLSVYSTGIKCSALDC